MLGASFGPTDGHVSRVEIESFWTRYSIIDRSANSGMRSTPGCGNVLRMEISLADPESGATIFDVTNPSQIRYCFVDFPGMESEREVQLMASLSARVYLEAHHELADWSNLHELPPLVESFEAWGLISTAVLEDAWPGKGWEEPDDEKDAEAMTDQLPSFEALRIGPEGKGMSLRDRAMDQVVQSLLDDPDNETSVFPEAELLSNFLPRLKSKLYEQADTLEPSSGLIEILIKALRDDVQVDLSRFQKFSPLEFSEVMSKLSRNGRVAALNLSNMPKLTGDEIKMILGANNAIRSLCLVNCPQVSIDALTSLDKGCDLYHSGLYKRAIVDTRIEEDEGIYSCKPLPRLDFSNQNADAIVQLVWIGISKLQAKNPVFRRPDGAMVWETLNNDAEVPEYRSPRRDKGLQYKTSPLIDTPLPLARLVTGISHLLRWGSMARLTTTYQFCTAAAGCFAMPTYLPGGQTLAVASASTELYFRNEGDGYLMRQETVVEPNLEPGQWSIILIHECINVTDQDSLDQQQSPEDTNRLLKWIRYALVSPAGDGFEVADMYSYLDHITARNSSDATISAAETQSYQTLCQGLRQWWSENFEASESMDFYGENDIHEILERVYLCAPEPEPE